MGSRCVLDSKDLKHATFRNITLLTGNLPYINTAHRTTSSTVLDIRDVLLLGQGHATVTEIIETEGVPID